MNTILIIIDAHVSASTSSHLTDAWFLSEFACKFCPAKSAIRCKHLENSCSPQRHSIFRASSGTRCVKLTRCKDFESRNTPTQTSEGSLGPIGSSYAFQDAQPAAAAAAPPMSKTSSAGVSFSCWTLAQVTIEFPTCTHLRCFALVAPRALQMINSVLPPPHTNQTLTIFFKCNPKIKTGLNIITPMF